MFSFSYRETLPAENDAACPRLGNWLCMYLSKKNGERKSYWLLESKVVEKCIITFYYLALCQIMTLKSIIDCIFIKSFLSHNMFRLFTLQDLCLGTPCGTTFPPGVQGYELRSRTLTSPLTIFMCKTFLVKHNITSDLYSELLFSV